MKRPLGLLSSGFIHLFYLLFFLRASHPPFLSAPAGATAASAVRSYVAGGEAERRAAV